MYVRHSLYFKVFKVMVARIYIYRIGIMLNNKIEKNVYVFLKLDKQNINCLYLMNKILESLNENNKMSLSKESRIS